MPAMFRVLSYEEDESYMRIIALRIPQSKGRSAGA